MAWEESVTGATRWGAQVLEKQGGGTFNLADGKYQERQPGGGELSVKSLGMSKCEAGQARGELDRNEERVPSKFTGAMSGDEAGEVGGSQIVEG